MDTVLDSPALSGAQPDLRSALARIAELETELRQLRNDQPVPPAPLAQMHLRDVEGWLVKLAMDRMRGNISRAAKALGLSRAALYRRLERHGMEKKDPSNPTS